MQTYQYSTILPCYCQAKRMFDKNITPTKVKFINDKNNITGEIIETRYNVDEHNREHLLSINHCNVCKIGKCK